jgi:hypothetical protein
MNPNDSPQQIKANTMHHKALAIATGLLLAVVPVLPAQDNHSRGRKYKPPPETSHIEVLVTKGYNKKPIENAAVIFHELRADGTDEGNLEVKTDPDGKAVIDVIPVGSNVRVQVLANGFATFAEDYLVSESSRQIPVTMLRPKEQISTYVDNDGKSSSRKAGVQEPVRPTAVDPSSKLQKPAMQAPRPAGPTPARPAPAATTPPAPPTPPPSNPQ